METKIAQVLSKFEEVCENWSESPGIMDKFAEYAYVWHPAKPRSHLTKPIVLSLQALTHGNELGGIESLLEFLQVLKSGLVQPVISLAFILGNPSAALANRRFLDYDLNRSFAQTGQGNREERRARILEPLLGQSSFFIDYHQTIEATQKPFFIFPYTPSSMALATHLHSSIPIVTHWGTSFSGDGKCSDEYVNYKGGTGLSIELGQKGFNPYQAALGLQLALAGVGYASNHIAGQSLESEIRATNEIYTWKAIERYEAGMRLDEGLVNFQAVKAGEPLGQKNGQVLRALADGWLLFPKYSRDPLAPPPKELYRIVKRIQAEELGKDGVVLS